MQKQTIRLISLFLPLLILTLLVIMRPTPAFAQDGPPLEDQSALLPGAQDMPVPPFVPGVVVVGMRVDEATVSAAGDPWSGLGVLTVEALDVRGGGVAAVSGGAVGPETNTETNPETLTVTNTDPLSGYKLTVPPGTEWDVIATLKSHSDVAFAEPDWYVQVAQTAPNNATPETPFAVTDTLYPEQWYLQRIGMSRAWSVAEQASGGNLQTVQVFIIDTGVDFDHPDLTSKLSADGFNYINHLNPPQDDFGHGTHVAGLVAAALNGAGIVGPGLNVKITPFKVLDSKGSGVISNVAQSIRDAADQGADIINLSLETSSDSSDLRLATAYAVSKGVLILAASGNHAATTVSYPAAYPHVLAVGATTYFDSHANYSNGGADLDLVAPGGLAGDSILSTWPGASNVFCPAGLRKVDSALYCEENGTSMATGIATGVAALIMSLRPDLDADQVQDILLDSAAPILGTSDQVGHGRLDAAKAVLMAVKPHLDYENDAVQLVVLEGSGPTTVTLPLTNPSLAPLHIQMTPTVTTTWYALVGPRTGDVSYGSPLDVQLVFTPTASGVGTFESSIRVTATVDGGASTIYFINVRLGVLSLEQSLHQYLAWVSGSEKTFHWAEPDFVTRTTHLIDSDGSLAVNLPFTMTAGDNTFTNLRIYADGFAVAAATAVPTNLPNRCLANRLYPPFIVDGWWSDLSVGPDSSLSTFQPDAGHFVIEYDNFITTGSADPADVVTFQIVLDGNGQVELNYEQVPKHIPDNLTIGVTIEDGRFYNQLTCRVAGTIQLGDTPEARQSFILNRENLY